MKMIIAKHGNDYVVTTQKNYFAYVQDAHKIQRLSINEWTPAEIIDYYCKYFHCQEEDFTIL